MQQTHILLGHLAAFLAIVQVIPYIHSIIRGETKPSRASYAIWLLIDIILVGSYLASGATTTKWMYFVLLTNSTILFLLSLRYGVGGLGKFDLSCIGVALVAMFFWKTAHNPELAVYLCTCASFMGYIPTEKKSYFFPNSENKLSWGIYVMAAFFNVCALTTLKPAIFIPPVVSFVMSSSEFALLFRTVKRTARAA